MGNLFSGQTPNRDLKCLSWEQRAESFDLMEISKMAERNQMLIQRLSRSRATTLNLCIPALQNTAEPSLKINESRLSGCSLSKCISKD